MFFVHTCKLVIGCRSRDFIDLAGKIVTSSSRDLVFNIASVLNAESFNYHDVIVNIFKPHSYMF